MRIRQMSEIANEWPGIKSNYDDIWHQIPSYTTTLSQNSKEQAVDRMRHGEMTEQQWDEPEED